MDNLDKEEMKSVYKTAIKEWLDEQFALVGKYTLKAIGVLGLGAIVYFILWANGWQKPH